MPTKTEVFNWLEGHYENGHIFSRKELREAYTVVTGKVSKLDTHLANAPNIEKAFRNAWYVGYYLTPTKCDHRYLKYVGRNQFLMMK